MERFHDNSPSHPYSTVRSLPNGLPFFSGVVPYDADGRRITTGEPEDIVDTCVAELRRRLEACGLAVDSIVQTTVHLTDIRWRDAVNATYLRTFRSKTSTEVVDESPFQARVATRFMIVRAPAADRSTAGCRVPIGWTFS